MKKKKLTIKIMSAIILVLLIALGILVIRYISDKNDTAEIKEQLEIDVNQDDYKENSEMIHSKNILLPGWTELTIAKDSEEITSGIDFYNPEGNAWYICPDCGYQLDGNMTCMNENCGHTFEEAEALTDCYYMTFSLYLQDGEVLYESNLVSPGKHIQHITLNRSLSEGDYDAYVFIQPYRSDRVTACNSGKVNIKLHVK